MGILKLEECLPIKFQINQIVIKFQAVSMSEGSLSALAVSDSGDFVATGSMFDGTVEIYIAYNLRVRKPYKCSGKYIEIFLVIIKHVSYL